MCAFCENDICLYDETLPTGSLMLRHVISILDYNKELYSAIYDSGCNIVEDVRININYCPMCGRKLGESDGK